MMKDTGPKAAKRASSFLRIQCCWGGARSEAKESLFQMAVFNGRYRLIHGKSPEGTDLQIKINSEYMNKKNGKITKNINFKGTNIIGFMAPFEVAGSPELIETGYEAGFGEKGSMGFGMVKEVN
ncbi:MAG: hypothetical protein KAJ10_05590 [Thermodesulfovibrionia bacterium]|nr:hypothetical protein [Thermodesulfovibrionia bacterium]